MKVIIVITNDLLNSLPSWFQISLNKIKYWYESIDMWMHSTFQLHSFSESKYGTSTIFPFSMILLIIGRFLMFWLFLSARRALLCFLFSCSSSNVCEISQLCPFSWVFFLPSLLRALPKVPSSSLKFPCVPSCSLLFPRVPSSSLGFYGFKWVQVSSLEFPWVLLSSLEFSWVPLCSLEKLMWKKGVFRFVSLFSWFFLMCFFLRALSYSTCLSIFGISEVQNVPFWHF